MSGEMRSRGSYRPTFCTVFNGKTEDIIEAKTNGKSDNKSVFKRPNARPEVKDVEMIDISDDENKDIAFKKVVKKRKSLENESISVITIESDEEVEEEVQPIDSDYESMSAISIVDEKPSFRRPSLDRCRQCLEVLSTSGKVYDYNRLTSADFYLNPRIHPSVISLELKDKTRFSCFEDSINGNKHLFKDKIVLIIGSCNGILALFAAKALARTVIVVDRTGISEIIESVIQRNRRKLSNFRTNFFVIRESIDEMVLPNGITKVDIIVSDWVNHSLFYKSMIDCLIKARDKWLRKDGLIFPDSAHMYLIGAHDYIHRHTNRDKKRSDSVYVRRVDYWDHNVYGFDMSGVRHRVLSEPLHESINPSQVITKEFLLKRFDFNTMSMKDLNFCRPFDLIALKDSYLQTFVLYFDVIFSKSRTVPLMYSTRPTAPKCLFRSTIFFMESEKQQTVNKDNRIKGQFRYELTPDLNQMSVEIDFKFQNEITNSEEKLVFKTC